MKGLIIKYFVLAFSIFFLSMNYSCKKSTTSSSNGVTEYPEINIKVADVSIPNGTGSYDFDEVIVGRDGILLERGLSRGLLLPQVAVEYDWDRETFLDHTCRKAGLEPGCWRHPDTVISTFSAQVFGEEDP